MDVVESLVSSQCLLWPPNLFVDALIVIAVSVVVIDFFFTAAVVVAIFGNSM